MKNITAKNTLLITLLLFLSCRIFSQSIDQTLSNLSSDAVIKYSEPAITAFSSNMNAGWFSGLPSTSTIDIHAKLRFIGIGSFFSDDIRNFSSTGNFRFTEEQADEILSESNISPLYYEQVKDEMLSKEWEVIIAGPTITGSRDEHVTVEFPGGEIQGQTVEPYTVTLEDVKGYLDNSSLLPTPALQLDVSGVAGTGISIRYFRGIDVKKLGNITIYGAGIVHNVTYWFSDPIPLDIGFGLYFQKFDIGDAFTNSASQFGLYVSKSVGVIVTFVPYMGLTYESSHSKLDYNYNFDTSEGPQTARIKVDYGTDNSVGFIIGSALNFPVVSVNVDFKFGQTQTGSVGLGFGF
jgi:hypothetical protein